MSSFTPEEEAEIREALGWHRAWKEFTVAKLIVLAVLAVPLACFYFISPPNKPDLPKMYTKPSGERIQQRQDGVYVVTTPDGIVRLATREEEVEYRDYLRNPLD